MLEMHFVLSDIQVPILVYWRLDPHLFLFPRNQMTQNLTRLQYLRLTFQPLMKVCFSVSNAWRFCFWENWKRQKIGNASCPYLSVDYRSWLDASKSNWSTVSGIMSSVIYIYLIYYNPFRLGYLYLSPMVRWTWILLFWILADLGKSRYISQTSQDDERPDLGNARVVITGGRALKNAENFKLIENLAKKLGGAGIILSILLLWYFLLDMLPDLKFLGHQQP